MKLKNKNMIWEKNTKELTYKGMIMKQIFQQHQRYLKRVEYLQIHDSK